MVFGSREWARYSQLRFFTLASAIVTLQACSSFKSDALLFVDLARRSVSDGPTFPTPSTGLDLKYRYLIVQVVGQPAAMLVLSTEHSTANGLLEVWSAADGSLIQTTNGRLGAFAGLATQWSAVRWIGVPFEGSAPVAPGSATVQRIRDVLPDYAYNVTDVFHTEKVDFTLVPRHAIPAQGDLGQWGRYAWLRERLVTSPGKLGPGDSWFAIGTHRGRPGVVASYQCIDKSLCLKTARWPLEQADTSAQ